MTTIELRLFGHYGAKIGYCEHVLPHQVVTSQEVDNCARNIENALTRPMQPELASESLSRVGNNEEVTYIFVSVNRGREIFLRVILGQDRQGLYTSKTKQTFKPANNA
jgi:hypothetical protein